MGSANWDEGQGIAVDGSGKVYVVGYSNATWGLPVDPYAGAWDAFAATLIPDDVSVPAMELDLPKDYKLCQNYPNPFNAVTEVAYSLAEAGHITLAIYNIRGQLVRTVVDGSQNAGEYRAVWDGRNVVDRQVASGLYFCRLKAGDFSKTIKMVLVK
jgi:hypothetical protein